MTTKVQITDDFPASLAPFLHLYLENDCKSSVKNEEKTAEFDWVLKKYLNLHSSVENYNN
jgi:hypothetical protein